MSFLGSTEAHLSIAAELPVTCYCFFSLRTSAKNQLTIYRLHVCMSACEFVGLHVCVCVCALMRTSVYMCSCVGGVTVCVCACVHA